MNDIAITLIGCGKMGSALLLGWLQDAPNKPVTVIDPQHLPEKIAGHAKVQHFKTAEDYRKAAVHTDILLLAVKPQIMDAVCQSLAGAIHPKALIISIAAGIKIQKLEAHFGADQPVVRAMPNTPAAIRKGITVAVANGKISATQKEQALEILAATGDVEWVEDETLMNAVTAISGSGPAYFFRFTEALAEAGKKLGLPSSLAQRLARKTFEGSAALSESEKQTPVRQLRIDVTSPGGTTEAALNYMNLDNKLQDLLDKATRAAKNRGEELSQ